MYSLKIAWHICTFVSKMRQLCRKVGSVANFPDSPGLSGNWLQVFRRADTARLGSDRRLQHQTRGVRWEKGMGLQARVWHSDSGDRHVFWSVRCCCPDLTWLGFLPRLQGVREIIKTCNQLIVCVFGIQRQTDLGHKDVGKFGGDHKDVLLRCPGRDSRNFNEPCHAWHICSS